MALRCRERAPSTTSNSEQLRVSISRPRCAQQRTSGYGSGIGRADLARNESATIDGLFRDGNARPGGHLNARGQKVLAVLGTEDRRVALLHLEPSLAERVDDVRLVRDRNRVGAALRRQLFFESSCRSIFLLEHDLFRKPVSTP